jgi:HME family heavy-metal exporter
VAAIEDGDGPNQVSRENSRAAASSLANTDGRDMSQVIADIRSELAADRCPMATSPRSKGQFQAQEQAARLIACWR